MIHLGTARCSRSRWACTFNTLYDDTPSLIQSGAMLALIIPVMVFLFAQRIFLKGIDLPTSSVQK